MKTDQVIGHIVNWLGSYCSKAGLKGFVIGVSGGIDSAVTSTLCAKTAKPVWALNMPILQNPDQLSLAEKHIEWLGKKYPNVNSATVDLSDLFAAFKKSMPKSVFDNLAQANTRSRIRMTTLYAFATHHKMLVAGTGNKVEDFPAPEEEVLDLDLGDFTPDEHQETDSFDLDSLGVNLEDLDKLDEDTEESEPIVEGEMDFNLDGIDLDLGDTAETEESALDTSEPEDINLDLASEDDTSEMSMQDETLEFADLGDLTLTDVDSDNALEEDLGSDEDSDELPSGANETWDEAGTKLDLARAYIEMDDKESAQSILEEVAKEGTNDQKDEARDLINQISAG